MKLEDLTREQVQRMYARKREEGFRPRGYAGYTACSLPPLTTRRVGGWSNTTCARRSASRGYHPRRLALSLDEAKRFLAAAEGDRFEAL
jgi:hypothetical protein